MCDVPALRFPEFTDEWQHILNKELFNPVSDKNKDKIITLILSASQTEGMIERNNIGIDIKFDENSVKNYKIVRTGDYVVHLRSFQGGFAFSELTGICSPAYTILRPNKQLQYGFLRAYFMSKKFIDSLRLVTYGIRDGKSISVEEWMQLYTNIPSDKEQDKIIKLFNILDERIKLQNKIIEKYESLIQAIIYKEKMDGISKGTWQKIALCKVLQERNEKNVNGRTICSVSVSQGVVNQVEYLGRSFAAKQTSHYNIVKYGDIVYTKSPTGNFPFGIIKRSNIREDVAVSPLYGVYIPVSDSIGVFLHFYFMQPSNAFNYLHPLIQKGAKNTINITNGRFLENSVPLPISRSETNTIAGILKTIQTKIEIEKNLLQSYTKEKKYLLRQMFI